MLEYNRRDIIGIDQISISKSSRKKNSSNQNSFRSTSLRRNVMPLATCCYREYESHERDSREKQLLQFLLVSRRRRRKKKRKENEKERVYTRILDGEERRRKGEITHASSESRLSNPSPFSGAKIIRRRAVPSPAPSDKGSSSQVASSGAIRKEA